MSASEPTLYKSADLCPTCLLKDKAQVQLSNRMGQDFAKCARGHEFPDTEELKLLQMQARSKSPEFFRQNNGQDVNENNARIAAGLITIDQEVRRAIEELAKVPITSGSDLKGLLYGYIHDNEDKDSTIRRLQATIAAMSRRAGAAGAGGSQNLTVGQYVVEVPEWAYQGLEDQAKANNQTPQEWVANEFSLFCDNFFGTPMRSA